MWVPDKWQKNLLQHFLRTGDYWCGLTRDGWAEYGAAMLIVGGNRLDLKKLYAIKEILGGKVIRASDWYRGSSIAPWDYLWVADELTEIYLRWLDSQWEDGAIDAHNRRRRVRECLRAYHESHEHC